MRAACRFALAALLLVLLVLLAACHDKPTGDAGSCFRAHDNLCIDYAAAQSGAGKRLCAGLTWTTNPCPSAGRLGSCAKADVTEQYYAGAPNNYDPASAKLACEHASGRWQP